MDTMVFQLSGLCPRRVQTASNASLTPAGGFCMERTSVRCCRLMFWTLFCASRTAGSAAARSTSTTSCRFWISSLSFASLACISTEPAFFCSASLWSAIMRCSFSFASASFFVSCVCFCARLARSSLTLSNVSLNFSRPTLRWRCCSSRSSRFSL